MLEHLFFIHSEHIHLYSTYTSLLNIYISTRHIHLYSTYTSLLNIYISTQHIHLFSTYTSLLVHIHLYSYIYISIQHIHLYSTYTYLLNIYISTQHIHLYSTYTSLLNIYISTQHIHFYSTYTSLLNIYISTQHLHLYSTYTSLLNIYISTRTTLSILTWCLSSNQSLCILVSWCFKFQISSTNVTLIFYIHYFNFFLLQTTRLNWSKLTVYKLTKPVLKSYNCYISYTTTRTVLHNVEFTSS